MNCDVALIVVQMLRNGDVYYNNHNNNLCLYCKGTDGCSKCTSGYLCDEIDFSSDVNNNFELYEYIKQTHPEFFI